MNRNIRGIINKLSVLCIIKVPSIERRDGLVRLVSHNGKVCEAKSMINGKIIDLKSSLTYFGIDRKYLYIVDGRKVNVYDNCLNNVHEFASIQYPFIPGGIHFKNMITYSWRLINKKQIEITIDTCKVKVFGEIVLGFTNDYIIIKNQDKIVAYKLCRRNVKKIGSINITGRFSYWSMYQRENGFSINTNYYIIV